MIADLKTLTMVSTCRELVQYGGISTMTLPTGRVSTPRRAIASQTRMPARARKSNGSRVRQSRTSSMPAIRPACRMSPTLDNGQSDFNSSRRLVSSFWRARMDVRLQPFCVTAWKRRRSRWSIRILGGAAQI